MPGFKVSPIGNQVSVLKVICYDCGTIYLTLNVGENYEALCPKCASTEVRECTETLSYECQPDGSLVDIRTLVGTESDPDFCTRCTQLTEDCECGTEEFEDWLTAQNRTPTAPEPEPDLEEEPEPEPEEEPEPEMPSLSKQRQKRWSV
jgi:hypothetical protein